MNNVPLRHNATAVLHAPLLGTTWQMNGAMQEHAPVIFVKFGFLICQRSGSNKKQINSSQECGSDSIWSQSPLRVNSMTQWIVATLSLTHASLIYLALNGCLNVIFDKQETGSIVHLDPQMPTRSILVFLGNVFPKPHKSYKQWANVCSMHCWLIFGEG